MRYKDYPSASLLIRPHWNERPMMHPGLVLPHAIASAAGDYLHEQRFYRSAHEPDHTAVIPGTWLCECPLVTSICTKEELEKMATSAAVDFATDARRHNYTHCRVWTFVNEPFHISLWIRFSRENTTNPLKQY